MTELEIQRFMESAIDKANAVQKATIDYEIARTSIEMLETEDRRLVLLSSRGGNTAMSEGFTLDCPEDIRQEITQMLKEYYEHSQKKAVEDINRIFGINIQLKEEEEKTKAKEEHKSIINEEFDAVVDEMIRDMDEETKKALTGEVAPVQQKRALTKDIISDEQLRKEFFTEKNTVNEIAARYGIKPSTLYKRIEKIKNENEDSSKEGACRRIKVK